MNSETKDYAKDMNSEILSQDDYISFDDILENKIGFGKFQLKIYLSVGLIAMSEYAESLSLGLILPMI
jgi:hypothetical protein